MCGGRRGDKRRLELDVGNDKKPLGEGKKCKESEIKGRKGGGERKRRGRKFISI